MLLGYLILLLPRVAAVTALLYLPLFAINRKRRGKLPAARHAVLFGLIGVVVSILYITIFLYGTAVTLSPPRHNYNFEVLSWLKSGGLPQRFVAWQLLLNILMFVPFGLGLPLVFRGCRRLWRTAACALLFTAAIETTQYFIGRSADIDDILMNFIGGLLGYLLFALLRRIFRERRGWKNATDTL